MTKKIIFFFILGLLILPLMSAADLVYIIKSKADNNILNAISEKGYSVNVIKIADISKVNMSSYKAIIVSDESFTSSEASKIPVNTKNSIVLNVKNTKYWNWVKDGTGSISPSQPKTLPIIDSQSKIVSGVNNNFPSYIDDGSSVGIYKIYYLPNAKKAPGVNTIVGDDLVFRIKTFKYEVKSGAVIATVRPGSQLLNGKI